MHRIMRRLSCSSLTCEFTVCRFMESELDLNDVIQEMHVIATIPELYHLLVELNAVHSLLGLLSHDNTDILSLTSISKLNLLSFRAFRVLSPCWRVEVLPGYGRLNMALLV